MKSPLFSSRLHKLLTGTLAILLAASTLLPGAAAPAQAAPHAAPPVPIQPAGETADTTPTFQWTKVAGASAYQLDVWKSGASLYVVGAPSSACGATLCSKTPATVLDFVPHLFRVRAKVAGVWEAWSPFKSFEVLAPGFMSNFNGGAGTTGWVNVHGGANWIPGATTVYSEGSANEFDSLAYIAVYSTFTYEARLRRSGCPGCIKINGLFFRGNPGELDPGNFIWMDTFYFLYHNAGQYSIGWIRNGSAFSPTGYVASPHIVLNSWNRLKVTANGDYMRFYINNVLVADGHFNTFGNGYVGLAFYDDDGRFDIDYANLSLSAPAAPDAAADAAGVLHLDESMAVPFDPFGSP